MRRDGFSLIEVLTATALLAAALGMVWGAWISANDTSEALDRKTAGTDATVYALAGITRELRQASASSLPALPGAEITYRIPEDRDGNGLPVDGTGAPELGEPRRIGRDLQDANGDGIRATQLVLEHDGTIEVLANGLIEDETGGANGSAQPLRGIWFEPHDGGVLATIRVAGNTRRNIRIPAVASQQITPRNP